MPIRIRTLLDVVLRIDYVGICERVFVVMHGQIVRVPAVSFYAGDLAKEELGQARVASTAV